MADTEAAFELKERARDGFEGGSVTVAGGAAVSLADALAEGPYGTDGVIVAPAGSPLASALDEMDIFKRVGVPEDPADRVLDGDYVSLTKAELMEIAAARGLDTSGTKSDLVDRLKADDGGDDDENGDDA